jgi:phosphoglycolate phosphatase-like HAD superfamily hydrolase
MTSLRNRVCSQYINSLRRKTVTTVLFWDIDGTLLTTARAGVFALEEAASTVIGADVSLTDMDTAGLTDRRIAINILKHCGVAPDAAKVDQLLHLYGQRLPASLGRKQGAVLEGVVEILERAHERTDVVSMLLTGNIEAGAKAKLTHYGLDGYFSHGAFSDKTEDRRTIARDALALAEAVVDGFYGNNCAGVASDQFYVIGDTPHDIVGGSAINARVIAVASGGYDLETLKTYDPWWALPCLPEPNEFFRKLGLEVA